MLPDILYLNGEKYQKEVKVSLPPGKYARILHDDEAGDQKVRIGMPEVIPLYFVEYTDLTEARQWFWFRLLVHGLTGYEHWDEKRLSSTMLTALKREWKSITHQAKAFTNNLGTDNCTDHINRTYEDCTPKQGAIYTAGNIVKVLGPSTNRGTPIETLDGNYPPPPIEKVNRLLTPWLVFCATNVAADKSGGYGNWKPVLRADGRHIVNPFPNITDIAGHKSRDTLVPIFSNGRKTGETYTRDGIRYAVNWIPTHRLAPVDHVPNPYVE